jgi:hypothetical protein
MGASYNRNINQFIYNNFKLPYSSLLQILYQNVTCVDMPWPRCSLNCNSKQSDFIFSNQKDLETYLVSLFTKFGPECHF